MAALAMERGDPEVSRFIDSYKLSQDAESRRAKYGGDTSLPLNSDGYEDKQRSLRDERHKDWLVQQEKPQVIRNALFEEQRQMEQEKLMARRRSPPRPAQPQQPQMDYNRSGEQARAEEKRDYQDYMKAKEERYWAMRGRPVTPAGGLDIGGYDRQVKETAHAKKKEYKEMLDQQQKEHMYLRARQEPEMAILDRNAQQSQYLANKPPPGPGHSRGRDEANKTETQTRPIPERPRYGQPPFAGEIQNQNEAGDERLNRDILERRSSPANQPPRSPKKPANPEWLQVPMNDGERPAELGTPLAFKTNSYSRQPPPAPERTPLSREVQLYEKYDQGVEGLFERPAQSFDRPRSRRSTDAARKYSPTKQEIVALPNLSPRRTKNTLYEDSEEVSSKRREASKERQKEYNDFLKVKAETQRNNTEVRQQQQTVKPAEVVKNAYYSSDDYEKFQKEIQRKQGDEYRDFLSKKAGTEVRNRDWNFDQNGSLELQGDGAVQSRQRELRAERQKEYNTFMSQIKTPPRQSWPDPDGRGAMLVMNGEYDNVRQMYDAERKKDYIDVMQRRREMGMDLTPPTAPSEPLRARYEYYNPMINALGRYDDFRQKLTEDRKRDFKTFMEQVKTDTNRREEVSTAPNIACKETPLIHSMGTYELETKQKIRHERKKEFEDYVHEQRKRWTPRTTVKENLMPHVASAETPLVNYLGQYDKEKIKFRLERNKDLRAFEEKKKQELRNPYDNYVFPIVAVAEKPIVDYLGTGLEQRKRDLHDERKQDYEDYKIQQKVTNPDRRHEFVDTANGPYGGVFLGLGAHDNRSDALNRERHQEYNESLNQNDKKYAGKERPSGRPNWAKDSIPNNTDRGRSPMRNQPPADQYQQMLDEKRREEASRRRYEDPEYQGRLAQGRDRGEAGPPRYGY